MNTARSVVDRLGSLMVGVVFIVLALVPGVVAGYPRPFLAGVSVLVLGAGITATPWVPRVAVVTVTALVIVQIGFPFALSTARDWPVYYGPAFIIFFLGLHSCPKVRLQGLGAAALLAIAATLLFGTRQQQAGRIYLSMAEAESSAQAQVIFWSYIGVRFIALMGGAWVVGFGVRMTLERFALVRERAATAEAMRQAELDLAVVGERDRISRELHDVLAHSLAVITAQADGARYLSPGQPTTVSTALENISGTARSALIDAQRVIENVSDTTSDKDTDAGNPGVAEVDALITQMRQGHLRITRTDHGAPRPLRRGQELAVYRIVQESLTNALKHAGPTSTVTLGFNWDGPGLTLHITSTPPTSPPNGHNIRQNTGSGRGIQGLRERVEATGGWLNAEHDGPTFITTAFIPYPTPDTGTSTGTNPRRSVRQGTPVAEATDD